MLITMLPLVILAIIAGFFFFRYLAKKGKNAGEPKVARTVSDSSKDQPKKEGQT